MKEHSFIRQTYFFCFQKKQHLEFDHDVGAARRN